MKNLHEIKKENQNKVDQLLNNCLVFWAFSNEQFAKNKTPLAEGEKYVSIGAGGYMPKSKVNDFSNGMKEINKWFKAEIKNNKAKRQNIIYELANHEAFYTGDLADTLAALGPDYTLEEVKEVYNTEHKKQTA